MQNNAHLKRKASGLIDAIDAMARRFMVKKPLGGTDIALTPQEFHLIHAVGARTSWTMGELAAHRGVALSSLTAVVDRLVAKRLVKRWRGEADRRVVHVALAGSGRRLYDRFRRHRLGMATAMLGALDEQEQDLYIGLMRKMGGAAPDHAKREDGHVPDGARKRAAARACRD
jgi:DNA-binding MarR family transcriptional regulator